MCPQCQKINYSTADVCDACAAKNMSDAKSRASATAKKMTTQQAPHEASVRAAANATGALQVALQNVADPPKGATTTFKLAALAEFPNFQTLSSACRTIRDLKLKVNAVTGLFDLGPTKGSLGHAISTETITLPQVVQLYDAIATLCTTLVAMLGDPNELRVLTKTGMLGTLKAWAASVKGCITSLAEDLAR